MSEDSQLGDAGLLEAITQLSAYYQGFPWESHVRARQGAQRSSYRVLLLFGLSARTKDQVLVETCRGLFGRFPNLPALLEAWTCCRTSIMSMVRQGQRPFLESAVAVIQQSGGLVPRDPDSLRQITGVGEKVAECVLAYGWGKEAMPMVGNGCRVAFRLAGLPFERQTRQVAYIRNRLKSVFNRHRHWMDDQGLAMIDIHEILRLHGQLVCTKNPACYRCPVTV